jgi:hypothetical protein
MKAPDSGRFEPTGLAAFHPLGRTRGSNCAFVSNLMNQQVDPNDAKANFSSDVGGSFVDRSGRLLLGQVGNGG